MYGFVCFVVGYISVKKKLIENSNSVGAEAHKGGKVASFGPTLTPTSPLGELKFGELYILIKVGFSTFKEIIIKICIW